MQPTVYPQKSIIIGAEKRDPLAVDVPPRRRWPLPHPFAQVGMALATLLLLLCIGAPLTAPHDPSAVNLALGLQPPSTHHWLGTDQFGRDVWSRVLWAGNTSITVTVSVLTLTTLLGLVLGLVSGYRGGLVDEVMMRFTELCDGLPQVIVALAIIGTLGPSTGALVAALAVTGWPHPARLVRSLVLRTRHAEYVQAATVIGAPPTQIMRRHLLPAVMGPLAVQVSLEAGTMVLAIAGLSFLGLGIQSPTPEWGTMLVEARPFLDYAPHLVLPPGLAIFVLVLGCNVLGEWLDDWLRPQG